MSDIFNNYAKIMEEKGLLKSAQRSSEAKTRPQGIDPEAIQMLYHVKPNGKDEKPIVEQAHPEPAYVAPAYDRMNGLVENVQERQNMMIEIMEDPQHGKLTQHRYVKANNELLQELIRVATYMDNKNQEDLMKLADSCASEITKESEFKKKAFGPLIAGVARVLLMGAGRAVATKVMQHGAMKAAIMGANALGIGLFAKAINDGINLSAGLVKDAEALIDQIDDLVNPNLVEEFSNPDLSAEDRSTFLELSSSARQIKSKALKSLRMRKSVNKEFSKLQAGTTDNTTSKFVNNEYHDGMKSFFSNYLSEMEDYLNDLNNAKGIIESIHQIEEGSGNIFIRLKRLVVQTDTQDIEKAIERLTSSLSQEIAVTQETIDKIDAFSDSVKEVKEKAEEVQKEVERDTELDLPEADLDQFIESLNPANETKIQMPEAAADDESY